MANYFKRSEFACKCKRDDCDAMPMRPELIDKLNELRAWWGEPIIINSGARCFVHNEAVGGSPESQHLVGNAVDVRMDPAKVRRFVEFAEKHDFDGIGVGQNFVHLDLRGYKAKWFYH